MIYRPVLGLIGVRCCNLSPRQYIYPRLVLDGGVAADSGIFLNGGTPPASGTDTLFDGGNPSASGSVLNGGGPSSSRPKLDGGNETGSGTGALFDGGSPT